MKAWLGIAPGAGLLAAGTAAAGDFGDRVARPLDRRGGRSDRRRDRRH